MVIDAELGGCFAHSLRARDEDFWCALAAFESNRLLDFDSAMSSLEEPVLLPLGTRAFLPRRRAEETKLLPASTRPRGTSALSSMTCNGHVHVVAPRLEFHDPPASRALLVPQIPFQDHFNLLVATRHRTHAKDPMRSRLASSAGLRPASLAIHRSLRLLDRSEELGASRPAAVESVDGRELRKLGLKVTSLARGEEGEDEMARDLDAVAAGRHERLVRRCRDEESDDAGIVVPVHVRTGDLNRSSRARLFGANDTLNSQRALSESGRAQFGRDVLGGQL